MPNPLKQRVSVNNKGLDYLRKDDNEVIVEKLNAVRARCCVHNNVAFLRIIMFFVYINRINVCIALNWAFAYPQGWNSNDDNMKRSSVFNHEEREVMFKFHKFHHPARGGMSVGDMNQSETSHPALILVISALDGGQRSSVNRPFSLFD